MVEGIFVEVLVRINEVHKLYSLISSSHLNCGQAWAPPVVEQINPSIYPL